MDENDTIYTRINNDCYKTKLVFPAMPRKPENLTKKAGDLSDAELLALSEERKAYERAVVEIRRVRELYAEDTARLEKQFWADLAEYHDIDATNEFYQEMCHIAYERGHSAGYS